MSEKQQTQTLSYADKVKIEPPKPAILPTIPPTTTTEYFQDSRGHHSLHDNWVLWYHDNNDDWSKESYRRIAEFGTVEEFYGIYNKLPSIVHGMWFLMRKLYNNKPIYPLWEDPAVINGGAWLFKVHKSQAENSWLNLSELMVGETICQDSEEIMGLSISPKKHYVTIRVWNRDKNKTDTSIFPQDIKNIIFSEAIYKPH